MQTILLFLLFLVVIVLIVVLLVLQVRNRREQERIRHELSESRRIKDDLSREMKEDLSRSKVEIQHTLDSQLKKSFTVVNEQLNEVFRGLGQMQAVAADVGDLKKVLSNVKTRGILGEIQLGAILAEIMAPGQYEENVRIEPGSGERVEFAIRLPGSEDGETVLLPIDAKFPSDLYADLSDARETGEGVLEAEKALRSRLKTEAKKIRDKYIRVPRTTDFAILFLPSEGLYAEAVRMGMPEVLQHEYRVTIAGPSTMAALLNSLQMGFRTLAVQRNSTEVWKILENVKSEFARFETGLNEAQNRIRQASEELDKLVGVRTRQINRALKDVQMPEDGE